MFSTEMYQAQPVEAIQVDAENREWIAEWTGGRVKTSENGRVTLLIPIGKPPRQKVVPAREGSWVVLESTGSFRVFYEKVFPRIFTMIGLSQSTFPEALTAGEGVTP